MTDPALSTARTIVTSPTLRVDPGAAQHGAHPQSRASAAARAASLAAFLVLLLLTSACASVPKQTFDKRANPMLKRIAVLVVPPPERFVVINVGGTATYFGAIGAAISGSDQEIKSERFTELLAARLPAFGKGMVEALTLELRKAGYDVLVTEQRPATSDGDEDARYAGIRTDGDAMLDVSFAVAGYVAPDLDYLPFIRVRARLVKTKSLAKVYAQDLVYGAEFGISEDVEHIPSNAAYAYEDFDALVANQAAAGDGLQAGIPLLARRIAEQLH